MDKRLHARRPRSDAIRAAVPVVVPLSLSGVDLVEFIAHNATLQKQRWMEIYRRLWERKAKIDIVDTILIVDGSVSEWFFTSSATGELQRKLDAGVTPLTIKRHFVRASDPRDLSRQLARLVFQDGGDGGRISYTLLTDLEFNLVLCQRSSTLWQASFLLQPLVSWQPPPPGKRSIDALRGTFVAKYNSLATTACTRVLQLGPGELYELQPSSSCSLTLSSSAPAVDSRAPTATMTATTTATSAHGARMRRARASNSEVARGLEEIVRGELRRLTQELERGFRDTLRLLTAEFQITPTQRLVLVRVSGVVFASDLIQPPRQRSSAKNELNALSVVSPGRGSPLIRPQSAPVGRKSSDASGNKCAGRVFCECRGVATALKASLPPASSRRELQQITRRSVSLSEEESDYLARFGAEAEAKLLSSSAGNGATHRARQRGAFATGAAAASTAGMGEDGETAKLLQRRLFMLRNTLWNPKSDAFNPKIMEFQDAQRLPQQYEMVAVCRTCYLIYHTIDAERFQVAQATAKEAAKRASAIYSSQLVASELAALSLATARSQRRRRGANSSIPIVSASVSAWASSPRRGTNHDSDHDDDEL